MLVFLGDSSIAPHSYAPAAPLPPHLHVYGRHGIYGGAWEGAGWVGDKWRGGGTDWTGILGRGLLDAGGGGLIEG